VTDNLGATDVVTQDVTVAAPTGPVEVGRDEFSRTLATGWGTADVGGAWSLTGGTSAFNVNGTAGRITAGAGQTRTATLSAVSADDVDSVLDVGLEQTPASGGVYVGAVVRRVGNTYYLLRTRLQPTATSLELLRIVNGAATVIASQSVPGVAYTAGSVVHLRFQVTGSAPTSLSGKLWVDAAPEPATWMIQATDGTAGLQGPGGVGMHVYRSGVTAGTNTVVVDRLLAIEV
jgi:hypothetical protein